jgi:putative alpha-1,2-mannosidase
MRDNNRYAPHDTGYLVELMGGNTTFTNRLDHFFEVGPSYGSS